MEKILLVWALGIPGYILIACLVAMHVVLLQHAIALKRGASLAKSAREARIHLVNRKPVHSLFAIQTVPSILDRHGATAPTPDAHQLGA